MSATSVETLLVELLTEELPPKALKAMGKNLGVMVPPYQDTRRDALAETAGTGYTVLKYSKHIKEAGLFQRFILSDDGQKIIRVGALEIRPEEGVVRRDDEPVSLTKTEFRLLTTLASRPGRVFSREQLLQEVWGYDYFGDARLVDVHIKRLRAKIEGDPHEPSVIQTVRGMGYKVSED